MFTLEELCDFTMVELIDYILDLQDDIIDLEIELEKIKRQKSNHITKEYQDNVELFCGLINTLGKRI